MDHYELLGLKKGATRKEIKNAYKRLANKSHPDKKTGNANTHKALTVAYNILSDPDKRERYDRTGQTSQAAPRDRWEILISSLFDILIGQDFRGDIIKECRTRLVNASMENQTHKTQFEQQAAALRKKLGRIKTKGGAVNFYEGLVAQKIEIADDNAKRCAEEIKDISEALDKLDDYTDTNPDEPEGPTSYTIGHGGIGGSAGWRNP